MAKGKTEEFSQSLRSWATDEMMFHTTAHSSSSNFQLPPEEDFKELIHKPLDDVWKYVLQHVKSVQTGRHVKGNIALKRNLGGQRSNKAKGKSDTSLDEEQDRLFQERARLTRELTSCLTDVSHLQKEMEQVTSEVMEAEMAFQSVSQRVRDLQKRECLLNIVTRCTEEKVAKYNEFTRRVAERVHEITKKSSGTEDNYIMGGHKHKDGNLETESCRDVRLACGQIGQFLNQTLEGSFSSDKTALKTAQKHLLEEVEKISASRSIATVVSAIAKHTEQTAKNLREETLQVNIHKDAQELSFSYGNKSGFKDLSSPPSIQKSVKQLLEASNLQHVMRWFKEQEHKNEEWKLTARLDDMMTEIHKHIHRVMGEHPRNVPLAKGYVDALIQLAMERTVAPCLRSEAADLVERIRKAKEERQELRLKYGKIQDFKQLVEKKQAQIGILAKQNASAPNRLESQRQEVISYITSRSIASHVTEVCALTDGLKGSLVMELERFSRLFLPCLLTVLLDSDTRLCVLDLSIAPSIHSIARERFRLYTDICVALSYPEYKSTESLFQHIVDVHNEIQDVRETQEHRLQKEKGAKQTTNMSDDIVYFIDLCHQVKQHDKAQCEKLLPRLQKRIDGVPAHIAEVANMKNQITAWWEQPAQFTTPWVVTEEMTFDQWMQRWRIAVTQVHKKMLDAATPQKK